VVQASIELRRANNRFVTRTGWATTWHSFSFGEHYDSDNVAFGPLMVSNDDRVESGAGYADHPHADAEIVTWVLSGSLVHADSAGHRGIVYPGLAQRMSAGSGIVHAERNDAYAVDPTRPAEPVHFLQMWLRPDASGGSPSYAQRDVALADLSTAWVPIASGREPDAAIRIGSAGSTLWVTRLESRESRQLPAAPQVHAYLAAGEIDVESVGRMAAGDSLRITGEADLRLAGHSPAELLVWTMTT
jgi:redox-sensitive bicupin YhaK (pirin superfamily)